MSPVASALVNAPTSPYTAFVSGMTCTCGSAVGCQEHGPQPREQGVRCRLCKSVTWNIHPVCDRCLSDALTA